MLQKGLSNRPSGAVALLIIAGSIALNAVRGENVLANLIWGAEAKMLAKLPGYAEQAACHVRNFFEETVIGAERDYGCNNKSSRKVVNIKLPSLPPEDRERHKPERFAI